MADFEAIQQYFGQSHMIDQSMNEPYLRKQTSDTDIQACEVEAEYLLTCLWETS